jgi:GntR family transcriptional regulator
MASPDLIRLDSTDSSPIYVQIDRGIRAAIATGRLPKGARLPTVREMAVALRVNANTVAKVYSELERQGVVETRRGVGTFVAEVVPGHPQERVSQAALRDFAARVLEEAAARGFSREEFVTQLEAQLKEDNRA